MIEYVQGTLTILEPGLAVLDCGGVGYGLQINLKDFHQLGPSFKKEVRLYAYQYVNENTRALFGFLVREDRQLFTYLLGLSGVGPKMAVSLMSQLSGGELYHIARSEDVNALKKIKGIGPQTAKKIIFELNHRLRKMERVLGGQPESQSPSPESMDTGRPDISGSGPRRDAILALHDNLGFDLEKTIAAVDQVLSEDTAGEQSVSLEDLIIRAMGLLR